MDISLKLLGIGAAEFSFGGTKVFIDAFNEYNAPPDLDPGDAVLFTHGDGDHFSASKLLGASRENSIIGPPSIAYPLLAGTGLDHTLLQIVYPPHLESPVSLQIGDIGLKVYQTRHFIGWEPDHVSFLFTYQGRRVYFTGDSHTLSEQDPDIHGLDALVYSLVLKDLDSVGSRGGAALHVQQLKDVQDRLHPQQIIVNHLIGCGWAVAVADLHREVEQAGLDGITIPSSVDEIIHI